MARRFKLFGRDILIGKRLFGFSTDQEDTFAMMSQKLGTNRVLASKLRAYRGIVYACVNLISEQAGGYTPLIYAQKGDQREYLNTHPLLELLRRPAGNDPDRATSLNQFTLFEATVAFILLQGEAYWYMARGQISGKPKEIILLRPDKVGIDIDKNTGDINGYFIRRSAGDPIPLEVNEVLHFPTFNPEDAYHGLGVVEAGEDYIETDIATSKFTKNFFNNNAGLSGVLNIKGEVTKGAFRKFVRAWRDKYEGVDNAGKVAIVRESDASFTKVGLGLDELDMSNLRKMTLDDVSIMFRVPLPLLAKADQTGMGRNNIEALEYIFTKYNVDPKFKRIDAVLQVALERYYGDTALTIDHESIIPADKEHELAERTAGVDKWITRNEIRDEEALDSVDGGDQLFIPINEIPVGTDDGTQGAGAAAAGGKGMTIKIRRKVKAAPAAKDLQYSTEHKERFRLSLNRNQAVYERRYLLSFKKLLKKQRAEALVNLEAKASAFTKDHVEELFNLANANKDMLDAIHPVLTHLTEQQGAMALSFAGDDETEFSMTVDILRVLENSTKKMAKNFNGDTLEKLNHTLAQGVQDGEGLGKLKSRVNDVFDEADSTRSLRVARTETLKASNNATEMAYKQTGYVKGKEWYVNPDACPICEVFSGKTIGLDEEYAKVGQNVKYQDADGNDQEYAVSYDDIDNPPLHPNCRCTIIPVR